MKNPTLKRMKENKLHSILQQIHYFQVNNQNKRTMKTGLNMADTRKRILIPTGFCHNKCAILEKLAVKLTRCSLSTRHTKRRIKKKRNTHHQKKTNIIGKKSGSTAAIRTTKQHNNRRDSCLFAYYAD